MNDNKNKNMLNKIKSKYIIKSIFEFIKINIFYKIIKYNKTLQNCLEIKIENYKNYCEKTDIILEIKCSDSKPDKFLDIDKKVESFYLIKTLGREINNNMDKNAIKIKKSQKITIEISPEINSLKNLFNKAQYMHSINVIKFIRQNIINMSYMFCDCKKIEIINISNFKTNNVKDMRYMFSDCTNLKTLNIDNFDTKSVANMSYMFYNCSSLIEINLSNFN